MNNMAMKAKNAIKTWTFSTLLRYLAGLSNGNSISRIVNLSVFLQYLSLTCLNISRLEPVNILYTKGEESNECQASLEVAH